MKRRFSSFTGLACLMALATGMPCSAADASKTIAAVAAGTDFFATGQPTTTVILGQTYTLTGVPFTTSKGKLEYGTTDTTVERPNDAVFPATNGITPQPTITVPITLTALQLTGTYGTAPNSCTMDITILGSPASTGTATLTVTSATGGTYIANLTVQYQVTFTPIPPNTVCPANLTGTKTMELGGPAGNVFTWSTKPPAGTYLKTGPYPDPNVNKHTGLPAGYVDFYPQGLQQHLGETVEHSVCLSTKSASSSCQP